jgi:hypothetical protein
LTEIAIDVGKKLSGAGREAGIVKQKKVRFALKAIVS